MRPAGAMKVAPWMRAEQTRSVMAALTAGGATARFVGGCVRDTLLGRPVKGAPMTDAVDLMGMLTEESNVEVVPTLGDLVAAKFAATGGMPEKVAELMSEAFDEVEDEATLAEWLAASGS